MTKTLVTFSGSFDEVELDVSSIYPQEVVILFLVTYFSKLCDYVCQLILNLRVCVCVRAYAHERVCV